MTGASTIRIGLLLPEVLGTYADAGNAAVLAARARWRGILTIPADSTPPAGCDVYRSAAARTPPNCSPLTGSAATGTSITPLDTSAHVLAVCAGLQILGQTMRDRSGQDHPGLGVLDVTTAPGRRRAVGEITTGCAIPGVGQRRGLFVACGGGARSRVARADTDVPTARSGPP